MNDEQIAQFRQFNRFHTRLVGALNEYLLASKYTLQQVRVMYELSSAGPDSAPSARDLSEKLGMDNGYMSRLIAGLCDQDLIERTPSNHNSKRLELRLTEFGQRTYAGLDQASANEVAEFLSPLSNMECIELLGAMSRIQRILGETKHSSTFILRDPRPGDIGWIAHQHGRLYEKEYDLDWTFEALVAEVAGHFANNFQPEWEKCWVAEREGEIIGSIFCVRQDAELAKLRLLYVDQSARGLGLGKKLVEECISFARSKKYKWMDLWTFDELHAARGIYEQNGFKLIEEKPAHRFGKDIVGQTWRLDL